MEEDSLQVPPSNRTAIYVRNLPIDQDPEEKLQADSELCHEYCKEHELEVVIEYSNPNGKSVVYPSVLVKQPHMKSAQYKGFPLVPSQRFPSQFGAVVVPAAFEPEFLLLPVS